MYSVNAIRELAHLAKSKGLAIHVDGARITNAVAAGFNPRCLREFDVDILVIGGTKAGMPSTEALVLLNDGLRPRFASRLKQCGQVAAKSRLLAAPWIGMLESGRWLAYAEHANTMARLLASRVPFEIAHPVESNAVFLRMDTKTYRRLTDLGWVAHRYPDGSVRFMCSWATSNSNIDEISEVLTQIAAES